MRAKELRVSFRCSVCCNTIVGSFIYDDGESSLFACRQSIRLQRITIASHSFKSKNVVYRGLSFTFDI